MKILAKRVIYGTLGSKGLNLFKYLNVYCSKVIQGFCLTIIEEVFGKLCFYNHSLVYIRYCDHLMAYSTTGLFIVTTGG